MRSKDEIIEKLEKHGITSLREGETVGDALAFVDGEIHTRKGVEIEDEFGKNERIASSLKESLSKYIRKPEYVHHDVSQMSPSDVSKENDYRTELSKVGEVDVCQYCGEPVRVDEGADFEIIGCEDCASYAIWDNTMS